jgi:lysophospholipase
MGFLGSIEGSSELGLVQRAKEDAPNGYGPAAVTCPEARPTIRAGTTLSSEEVEWLKLRQNHITPSLRSVLSRANITNLDVDAYLRNITDNGQMLPSIAIAVSGGGYRALMNGAGALAAFDNRTANATGPGQLGGILQAATYISGLSGGSWLVGSLYVQNFTTVESIIDATSGFLSSLWQFNETIFEGASLPTSRSALVNRC